VNGSRQSCPQCGGSFLPLGKMGFCSLKCAMESPGERQGRDLDGKKARAGYIANKWLPKLEKCMICGSVGKIHKHHLNYKFPLLVVWLCIKCHRRVHSGQLDLLASDYPERRRA